VNKYKRKKKTRVHSNSMKEAQALESRDAGSNPEPYWLLDLGHHTPHYHFLWNTIQQKHLFPRWHRSIIPAPRQEAQVGGS
jgi:hypothetical protein